MPRILTTHAGSLPRPPELTSMLTARFDGKPVDQAELEALSEQAARESIAAQIAAGLDIINNGEQGRESFITYVISKQQPKNTFRKCKISLKFV